MDTTEQSVAQTSSVEHAEIDFTYLDDLNARELGQRIVGTICGMMVDASSGSHHFKVRVDDDRKAGVVVALADSGWQICRVEWGGSNKQTVYAITLG